MAVDEEQPAPKRLKVEGGQGGRAAAAPSPAAAGDGAPDRQQQQQQQPNGAGPPPGDAGAGPSAAPAAPDGAAPPPAAPPPLEGPPYSAREESLRRQEESGDLAALYVTNDGSPEAGPLLAGLKEVFSKCLPNMPKEYIARLVFDRRHRSVVVARGGVPVAGVTYRPFHAARFAEIAFCAVAQSLQVSGFGTRLMNWTKHHAREADGCEYFLTYADNAAVGYFVKQGFTKAVSMPRERWHGLIKDYDGGTLMECVIHPRLPHAGLPALFAAQRAALDAAIAARAGAGRGPRPGLTRWRDDPGAGPIPVADIPGVREAGWDPAAEAAAAPRYRLLVGGAAVPPTPANLRAYALALCDRLAAADEAWPFRQPVDTAAVPDYLDVVPDPMDLATLRARAARDPPFYTSLDMLAADANRIWANAKRYNAPDTVYWRAAHKMAGVMRAALDTSVVHGG